MDDLRHTALRPRVAKTVFGPDAARVVVLLGVEGVGHHLLAKVWKQCRLEKIAKYRFDPSPQAAPFGKFEGGRKSALRRYVKH